MWGSDLDQLDQYEEYELDNYCRQYDNSYMRNQVQEEVNEINILQREIRMISDACLNLLKKLEDPQTKSISILHLACDRMDENEIEEEDTSFSEINFSLKSKSGEKKRLDFIKLVHLILKLVEDKRMMLLRDVYYFLKSDYKTQKECNLTILQLGRLLRLKRHQMRIIPSTKGLIAGNVRYRFIRSALQENDWICCSTSSHTTGYPIDFRWLVYPTSEIEIEVLDPQIRYLLVVEKECIFYRLLSDEFIRIIPCIMITSCGYPDVSTRAAVRKICSQLPLLDIIGICDYNPHGISLLSCYRHSSSATAFEAFGFQTDIKWLGLRGSHVNRLQQMRSEFHRITEPLSRNDLIKLEAMIRKVSDQYQYQELLEELKIMMQEGRKCELESLYHFGLQFLQDYLISAILAQDFISLL